VVRTAGGLVGYSELSRPQAYEADDSVLTNLFHGSVMAKVDGQETFQRSSRRNVIGATDRAANGLQISESEEKGALRSLQGNGMEMVCR
jgi:hypothetical protein